MEITISGQPIQIVYNFFYLGCIITNNNLIDIDITIVMIRKESYAFECLMKVRRSVEKKKIHFCFFALSSLLAKALRANCQGKFLISVV